MHREVQHPAVVVEDVLGAVAVVYVPVQDGDPLQPAREGVAGGDGGVVGEAEPHPVVSSGMVARRTGDGEGRLAGEGAIDGRAGGPAGERGSLPGTLPQGGVRAEIATARPGHLPDAVEVGRVVYGGEVILTSGGARTPFHGYTAPMCLLDTREGRGESLRALDARQLVHVAPRGRVTVYVQTSHPRSRIQ